MNVFRNKYNYWIAMVLSLFVQVEWAYAAPPFASVGEEIDYHRLQSDEAKTFFNGTMVNGMTMPGAGGNAIQYKEYNETTGAWDVDADEQIMPASAAGDTTIDDLKALANSPSEINTATGAEISAGANEAYELVDYGLNKSSHPNLWNDPFLDSSKEVLNNISDQGLQTSCDSTTTTTESTSDIIFEDIRSCLEFRAPPSCSVTRVITNVEKEGSCGAGATGPVVYLDRRVDYDTDFVKIRPQCGGGGIGQASFSVVHGKGRFTDVTHIVSADIDPGMSTWAEVMSGEWQGKDCDAGFCRKYHGTSTLSYRALACVESEVPQNNWACSIEWRFWTSRGSSSVTAVMNFERLHQIYTVREDFVYDPPGCNTSDVCEILPDPEYTPSASPDYLESTSTETWECTDASNGEWYSGVKIDPTDPTIEGIYLPTRIDGPKALFPRDNEELVCYAARSRNYQCSLEPLDTSGYLGSGYIERPDGTFSSSDFNVDVEKQAERGCDILEDDTSCSWLGESAVVYDSAGQALVIERTYDCGFTESMVTDVDNQSSTDCGTGPIRCMGDECIESWDESNDSFAEAAAQTSVLGLGSQDMNCVGDQPGDCTLFTGEPLECKYGAAGAVDCCNGGGSQEMQAYVATFMVGYKANAELDITGTMAEYAKMAYEATPIAEPINGAWGWVQEGAADLATKAGNSLGNMASEMGMDFLKPVEGKAFTFCSACTNLYAEGSMMMSSAVQNVAQWTFDTFGKTVTQAFFSDVAVVGGEVSTSGLGGVIGMGLNVIMWTYMAYQLTMLALQLAYKCDDEEFVYQQKVIGRSCTPQQRYCKEDLATGGCWLKAKASCCFESPLARIIHEQAAIQGVRPDFGDPESLNCDALSVEQLSGIDWDAADLSEWIEILTVSGQLPNGADAADTFFGRDNISRATILSEADIETERSSREDKKVRLQENLDSAKVYEAEKIVSVDKIEAEIAQLNADLTMLEAQIPPNELVIDTKKDELDVKDQQLIESQEDLANAIDRVAYYQAGVTNGVGTDIADIPNQSTINSRLDERIAPDPGDSLEKFRHELREGYWNAE